MQTFRGFNVAKKWHAWYKCVHLLRQTKNKKVFTQSRKDLTISYECLYVLSGQPQGWENPAIGPHPGAVLTLLPTSPPQTPPTLTFIFSPSPPVDQPAFPPSQFTYARLLAGANSYTCLNLHWVQQMLICTLMHQTLQCRAWLHYKCNSPWQ